MKGLAFAVICLALIGVAVPVQVCAEGRPASAPTTAPTTNACNIVEGTRTQTALGGGTWRCWFNSSRAYIFAANAEAIWFSNGSALWRYDVSRKKVDIWTSSLTHPELTSARGRLSDDGKLAASCQGAVLLWDKKQWSRLPQPGGDTNQMSLAFDGRGELWATNGHNVFHWDGSRWGASSKMPRHDSLWAVGQKWLMWDSRGLDKPWKAYTFWDAGLSESQDVDRVMGKFHFAGQMYRAGKVLMGVFWPEERWYGQRILCEVTDSGFVERIRDDYVCLDLASGQAFRVKWPAKADGRIVIEGADGQVAAELPPRGKPRSSHGVLLRDANGDYWLGHWRCDGKSWALVMPPGGLEFGDSLGAAVRQGRLRYDPQSNTWSDAWAGVPADVRGYDPATRIGWLVHDGQLSDPTVSEKFRFAPDGTRTLLATIKAGPLSKEWPGFCVELGDDVWLAGAYRWDGRKLHYYDDGWEGRGSATEGTPVLLASPKGNVWMYHTRRTWRRFNSANNKFEDATPFEEFAFKAGGRSLAIVGWPHDSDSGDPGKIYRCDDERWKPLEYPFVAAGDPALGRALGECPVYAVPGLSIHNGRMLLCCRGGVFEWDLKANRYAYLAPLSDHWALFDGERRLMVSDDSLLMYEGEPFAAKATSRPSNELEAILASLLKAMDSDSWSQRDAATKEAINLIRKNPTDVSAILERPDWAATYSPEVKPRVEMVLRERAGATGGSGTWEGDRVAFGRMLGNSLLERMHPPSAARIRYLIEPGMDYEQAKSVFVAAGARYSFEIHNAVQPRGSPPFRRGYLLPDNTMVYVSVDRDDEKGKIVTVGLGEAGKGNDPNWDWNDAKRNALKSLELKPYAVRSTDW